MGAKKKRERERERFGCQTEEYGKAFEYWVGGWWLELWLPQERKYSFKTRWAIYLKGLYKNKQPANPFPLWHVSLSLLFPHTASPIPRTHSRKSSAVFFNFSTAAALTSVRLKSLTMLQSIPLYVSEFTLMWAIPPMALSVVSRILRAPVTFDLVKSPTMSVVGTCEYDEIPCLRLCSVLASQS